MKGLKQDDSRNLEAVVKVRIREALLEDCKTVWEWWNDPTTRKMMKKNELVEWIEHCVWFESLLKDDNRILCIGLIDTYKIGNVRFDLKSEGIYEVSINMNPSFRGRGYAGGMLAASVNYLKTIQRPEKLFAKLKKTNTPSRKTFERAGFIFIAEPRYDHAGMEDYVAESELYCELIP